MANKESNFQIKIITTIQRIVSLEKGNDSTKYVYIELIKYSNFLEM